MAEFSKSVSEVKQAISDHISKVDTDVANTAKDLGTLTQNIMTDKSSAILHFKEKTTNRINNVQKNYALKEKEVHNILTKPYNPNSSKDNRDIAEEYENILRENVDKLKEIVQEDFVRAHEGSQKLIEEAKGNLRNILTEAFNHQESKKDFAKTTKAIFISINEKIREDLERKNKNVKRARSSLAPDYTNVFLSPTTKSPEEIEAEQELQKLFEDQLMEYSEQFKNDFLTADLDINKQVQETKDKLDNTIQTLLATQMPAVDIQETSSLPNFPTKSTMQQNIDTFMKKTENDFQNINESMKKDVDNNRTKLNENVKYYSEKLVGKRFFTQDDD